MSSSLNVLLVGAGALGSMFAWRLQISKQVQVTAVCRSNYEAVKSNGFQIESQNFGSQTFRPSKVVRTVDEAVANGETYGFILLCTKALPNLGDNSDIIAPAVTNPKTIILLIQNGIGIEDPFYARYPGNPIVSVVAYIDVSQPSNGVISHGGSISLMMGLFNTSNVAYDVAAAQRSVGELSAIWNDNGAVSAVVDNIQAFRWLKLVWNASFNTVAVVSGGNDTHKMLADPRCKELIKNLMLEVYRLGEAAIGEPLPSKLGMNSADDCIDRTNSRETPVMPSMLMDYLARRPMEHEVILGRPIEIARKLSVDVPYMKAVYAMLVMVEKGYMDSKL
ncbi:hypothetical protein GGI25_002036 [Coemansia spiralis]|uniref:2-dehydropantoate 2-reductase n=2 Tax=Coemansia TaxID=4863 RepID=A0A9W8G976_9FUNG|nr:2-dehydropantoate 2-reductase [Coemansia spiralis]KAJ1992703.1 hypothetical protein EDC05_002647 [Coemansia umbellata]KAJ2623292.1 hypothetical protein GGI26_002520 [Coemansia sp. RSA 1358]KAJ2678843.1 hypothetical protein GGI25_002036 [Coemansia spiralis]